jgi:hypothetical protein
VFQSVYLVLRVILSYNPVAGAGNVNKGFVLGKDLERQPGGSIPVPRARTTDILATAISKQDSHTKARYTPWNKTVSKTNQTEISVEYSLDIV